MGAFGRARLALQHERRCVQVVEWIIQPGDAAVTGKMEDVRLPLSDLLRQLLPASMGQDTHLTVGSGQALKHLANGVHLKLQPAQRRPAAPVRQRSRVGPAQQHAQSADPLDLGLGRRGVGLPHEGDLRMQGQESGLFRQGGVRLVLGQAHPQLAAFLDGLRRQAKVFPWQHGQAGVLRVQPQPQCPVRRHGVGQRLYEVTVGLIAGKGDPEQVLPQPHQETRIGPVRPHGESLQIG